MRGRKAALNTAFSLLEELVSVICGFILPRLILSAFGSKYNGLTASITQFLSCAVLLRSGIGGATRAALYKPLAKGDYESFNRIVKATDIFMKKIGLILGAIIIGFAVIYPFLVKNEFGWFFTFTLFLIIGASTFAESFFGVTYLIVLQADQRLWVSSLMKIICYIANTLIGVILILNGAGIHLVKLGSATVYVLYPIAMGIYVRRYYNIDMNCEPDYSAIKQRWDAFWQQVGAFVMNNTDVMVLTTFTNLLEVSVYAVYNMVIHGLKRLVISMSTGLEAAFGNMIAKNEQKVLNDNVVAIELVMFNLCTILYTCTALLILGFVGIYTKNVTDVNYIRPAFAYTILLAQFFNGVRLPYQMVVQAAGHYKQTKNGAIFEPIMNITLSILFVFKYGLVGVAVGTLAATIFRTVQYSEYMRKNLVIRSWYITPMHVLVSALESALTILAFRAIGFAAPSGYGEWVIQGIASMVIATIVVAAGSMLFYRKETKLIMQKIRNIVHKKK